ncbi:homoserine O-acetyltransferase [Ilumatobacteraceae bacterium]|nr:homoserine O-acetyltransferase [Ilumatobacteraceae bacterium]
MSDPLPVSGGWQPGDDAGRRKFFTFADDRPFALDSGDVLSDVTIAYESWGELAPDASNAILVCHAWTGDSHAAGRAGRGHPAPGWWDALIGPGRAIDTNRWFVVCSNVLGGCQGSTGPSEVDPRDPEGRRYGPRFPVVTIRDMVRAQARLGAHLGIERWASVIGGSMGGMQVLEWAATYPRRVGSVVPIATCLQSTAQQIAWGMIGRRAIALDPRWRGGDYYDAPEGDGPGYGLAVARQVAQVTFRSDNVFTERFGRGVGDRSVGDGFGLWQEFQVESYLAYHGEKLARRFDTNSYLVISKAMDLHDVSRGRQSVEQALRGFSGPCLSIGVSSDMLYPAYQQRQIADAFVTVGADADYVEVDSPHGHDAFLMETEQVGAPIGRFLGRLPVDHHA